MSEAGPSSFAVFEKQGCLVAKTEAYASSDPEVPLPCTGVELVEALGRPTGKVALQQAVTVRCAKNCLVDALCVPDTDFIGANVHKPRGCAESTPYVLCGTTDANRRSGILYLEG